MYYYPNKFFHPFEDYIFPIKDMSFMENFIKKEIHYLQDIEEYIPLIFSRLDSYLVEKNKYKASSVRSDFYKKEQYFNENSSGQYLKLLAYIYAILRPLRNKIDHKEYITLSHYRKTKLIYLTLNDKTQYSLYNPIFIINEKTYSFTHLKDLISLTSFLIENEKYLKFTHAEQCYIFTVLDNFAISEYTNPLEKSELIRPLANISSPREIKLITLPEHLDNYLKKTISSYINNIISKNTLIALLERDGKDFNEDLLPDFYIHYDHLFFINGIEVVVVRDIFDRYPEITFEMLLKAHPVSQGDQNF